MKTGTSDQDDQDGGVVVVSNSDGVSEDVAALLETYAAEIGPATPMVRDELGALVERYGAEDVADALRVAVLANVRKLGHVKGTLKNRAREGKLLRDGRQLALMPAVEVTPPKPATTDLRETGAAAPAASWTPPAPMREGPTPPPAASAHDIDAWKTALHQLRLQMPGSPWLEGARLHRAEGDEFVVNVGSPAAREMLQHRLYRNVVRVLSDACGRTVRVLFESPDVAPRLPVFQVQGA